MCLRFTIRDLLWVTLVVALAAGWYLDHENASIQFWKGVQAGSAYNHWSR